MEVSRERYEELKRVLDESELALFSTRESATLSQCCADIDRTIGSYQVKTCGGNNIGNQRDIFVVNHVDHEGLQESYCVPIVFNSKNMAVDFCLNVFGEY